MNMKKAKIIVLSGQSNAVGVGYTKYLKRSFSDGKIKEYYDGYKETNGVVKMPIIWTFHVGYICDILA